MIPSASRVLKNHPKTLALLFLVGNFLAQTHPSAQDLPAPAPGHEQAGLSKTYAVVVQRPLVDVDGGWLQFAAEDALISKIQEIPGWQASGWLAPAEMSQEQILSQIREETGAGWVLQPEASRSSDQTRVSVRVFELTASAGPKVVEASARPGRLPSLLLRTVRLTLEAFRLGKDQVEALTKAGLGSNSNLALERYYRASAAWFLGDRENALAGYESSLAADADFQDARRALANGNYDLAQEACLQDKWDDAAGLFQKSADTFQYLATRTADKLAVATSEVEKQRLQSQLDSDRASEKICQALARFCHGLIRRDEGDLEGARADLEAALALDNELLPARIALAGLQLLQAQQQEEKGELSAAQEGYLAAAQAYSSLTGLRKEALALAGASRCAEKQGHSGEAVSLLIEAAKGYTSAADYRSARDLLLGPSFGLASTFGLLEDNPSRSKAHYLLAVGFMRSSERALRGQCETSPDGTLRFVPTGDVIAAEADLSQWKKEKAVEEAQKASNLDPKDAASFLLLGRAYLFADHPDSLARAIEAFSTAKNLQPESIEPRVLLAEALFQANQFNEAEKELLVACQIPLQPDQEDWANRAWGSLGRLSNRLRKYREAADAFEKAVSFSSEDAISYFGWATALFHLGRFEQAKEKLGETRRLAPGLPGIEELQLNLEKAIASSTPPPS